MWRMGLGTVGSTAMCWALRTPNVDYMAVLPEIWQLPQGVYYRLALPRRLADRQISRNSPSKQEKPCSPYNPDYSRGTWRGESPDEGLHEFQINLC